MEFNKETFAQNCMEILSTLHQFYKDVCASESMMSAFAEYATMNADRKTVLSYMIYADAITCIENSGHSSIGYEKEAIPVKVMFYKFLEYDSKMTISQYFDNTHILDKTNELVRSVKSMTFFTELEHGSFNVTNVLAKHKYNIESSKYSELMLQLAKCIAYADNTITETEKTWVKLLKATHKSFKIKADGETMEFLEILKHVKKNTDTPKETAQEEFVEECIQDKTANETSPLEQLSELIGLSTVKKEVNDLNNLVKMQKVRESRGLKATSMSYHCVFTGNPGTGKTTVARILANIYKELGVLNKGHLVETDRSGLVAEYVGQTAVKTNEIIDRSLDGVLFIDEAYSLSQGGHNDYGKEAIATLLKRMEDERGRFVVILAGYSAEMEGFINSNSGLQSRFTRYIDFPDYNQEELLSIFDLQLKSNQYVITDSARQKVSYVIESRYSRRDKNFGNARYVRNLFEKIITQQANRLAAAENITDDMLMEIIDEDVILDGDTEFTQQRNKIGFTAK